MRTHSCSSRTRILILSPQCQNPSFNTTQPPAALSGKSCNLYTGQLLKPVARLVSFLRHWKHRICLISRQIHAPWSGMKVPESRQRPRISPIHASQGLPLQPKVYTMQGFRIPGDLIFLLIPEADSPHSDSNLSDRNCLICISLTSFCSAPQRYNTALAGEGQWQKNGQLADGIVVAVPGIEPGLPD